MLWTYARPTAEILDYKGEISPDSSFTLLLSSVAPSCIPYREDCGTGAAVGGNLWPTVGVALLTQPTLWLHQQSQSPREVWLHLLESRFDLAVVRPDRWFSLVRLDDNILSVDCIMSWIINNIGSYVCQDCLNETIKVSWWLPDECYSPQNSIIWHFTHSIFHSSHTT